MQIIITEFVFKQIEKTFSVAEANKVLDLFETLKDSPKKGKALGNIGGVVIKELRYKKFRFYFITNGHILKFGSQDELASLLVKFVRMSEKKDQQKTIQEIKDILQSLGFDAF